MAELLVYAIDSFMEGFDQAKIDSLDDDAREKYEMRQKRGDVIAVRPDGWEWGKKEGPPRFVIIKIPNMTAEQLRYLEEEEMPDDGKGILQLRKNQLDVTEVDRIALKPKGREEVPLAQRQAFLQKFKQKKLRRRKIRDGLRT